jgi:nucleotide-binding universal stress UspA family protein
MNQIKAYNNVFLTSESWNVLRQGFDIKVLDSDMEVERKVNAYTSTYERLQYIRKENLNVLKQNLGLLARKLGTSYKTKSVKGNTTFKPKKAMNTIHFKKILIPTDFSETGMLALDHAVFMARLMKAQLFLLHVVEVMSYVSGIDEPEVVIQDIATQEDLAQEKIEKLALQLSKEHNVKVTPLISNGKPAKQISDAVKENDIDIIIMGTHGAHGFEEYFLGSNAHKVVNLSPCPVITVQQHAKKMGFRNIVMPIDNSLYSRQKVDYVIKLATIYASKVHLLGLLHSSSEELERKKFNIKIESVEQALKHAEVFYVKKTVKGSNIAEEAMKYSEGVGADLLVIMTDHESHLKGALLGSLAKQIVNHSRIPVMSIRPLPEGNFDTGGMSASSPLF